MWIWQQPDWPNFTWQEQKLVPLLRAIRKLEGVLEGKSGFPDADNPESKQTLDTLLQNITSSSAIEGEQLNAQSVQSSLAKRLGISDATNYPVSDRSEGLASIMMDIMQHANHDVGLNRLCVWHLHMFPESDALHRPEHVGKLRGDDPMQVVSGRIDKPTVHFEAPPRTILEAELKAFLNWFKQSQKDESIDPIIRAALTHFWFITLHPFDDGNGRLCRALTDLALMQHNKKSVQLYSMSAAILEHRKEYYQVLEHSQRNGLEITLWMQWFLITLEQAIQNALDKIDRVLDKTRFWQQHQSDGLNKEQIKVLNRLLDGGEKGFELGISASQYQKVTRVSKATATRHLADLLAKKCLQKLPGGGRSTRYEIRY